MDANIEEVVRATESGDMPEVAASRSVELTALAKVSVRVDHMLSRAVAALALLMGVVVEPNVADSTWIVENVYAPVQSEWALMWEQKRGKQSSDRSSTTCSHSRSGSTTNNTTTPLVES